MLKSMTGYGASVTETPDFMIRTEIKSLNSKFLELKIKLPADFSGKEAEIKSLSESRLMRGKIDILVNIRYSGLKSGLSKINKEIVIHYFNEINELCRQLSLEPLKNIEPLLKIPEIYEHDTILNEADNNEWQNIIECVEDALMKADEFRISEGSRLEKEILSYLITITDLTGEISLVKDERNTKIREKIFNRIAELKLPDINQERFEQEMIYYIEKIDITEELERLNSHILHFHQCLNENESGRKLGFIAQEMGREINTIGSKANNYGIQQKVVLMKNELEKIRQQLANIL